MTETRRWLETGQAPPDVLELLQVARPPSALDAQTRARSRRQLAALSALPAAAGITLWIKSVALGAAISGVVTAVVVVPRWRAESASRVAAVTSSMPASHVAAGHKRGTPATDPALSASNSAPAPVPQVPAPNLSNRSAESPTLPPPESADLSGEIQLLDRARGLIDTDPALAFDALLEHQREFGAGTLVLERKFLEVEALWHLGRRAQARSRAAALRAYAPGSIYERRLSQLLGESPNSPSAATANRSAP
jgi:hypothetical protein